MVSYAKEAKQLYEAFVPLASHGFDVLLRIVVKPLSRLQA
jgi:hypothetical protein